MIKYTSLVKKGGILIKRFSRKFLIVSDLDNYEKLLLSKIEKAGKKINMLEFKYFFETLRTKRSDLTNICEKLRLFDEEDIITNAKLFNDILKLSNSEARIILNEYNYPSDNKYNIFDLIIEMYSDYKEILKEELLEAISFKNCGINETIDVANKYENLENKYLVIYVNERFYNIYQSIEKYPVLLEIFYKLNNNIGNFSRDFIIDYVSEKRKQKKWIYYEYKVNKLAKEISIGNSKH